MTGIEFEKKYWWDGKEYVIGLDEAGRGPLAGPLVVAGVIFPPFYQNDEIDDSKILSREKREKLYKVIMDEAIEVIVEILSVEEVDFYNVYQGSRIGMERIVRSMKHVPEAILTDAMPLNIKDIPVESIIKGDQKSLSIAAASIIAKVTRDNIMLELHNEYPEYGFDTNKGYCTLKHMIALEKHGIRSCHRKSFSPVNTYIVQNVQITIDDLLKEKEEIIK